MFVPQRNELEVLILNGTEPSPLPSMNMLGYVALPSITVTPGVEVVRVAEMADSLAHPLFFTPILRKLHSARLTMPFPFPVEASSTTTPLASSFEVPLMV